MPIIHLAIITQRPDILFLLHIASHPKENRHDRNHDGIVELSEGIEPATYRLQGDCTTVVL